MNRKYSFWDILDEKYPIPAGKEKEKEAINIIDFRNNLINTIAAKWGRSRGQFLRAMSYKKGSNNSINLDQAAVLKDALELNSIDELFYTVYIKKKQPKGVAKGGGYVSPTPYPIR